MKTEVETPQQIRKDIEQVRMLVLKAEAEGTADALAAKSLFLQTIARLKMRLAELEAGTG